MLGIGAYEILGGLGVLAFILMANVYIAFRYRTLASVPVNHDTKWFEYDMAQRRTQRTHRV